MLAIVKQSILATIEEEWRSLPRLPGAEAPWAMWVRWYAPIPDDGREEFSFSSMVPLQAWFLSKEGYSERSVWEYQRFLVVQWLRPWCLCGWPDPSIRRGTTGYHEIGFADFATYQDSTDIYLGQLWGGLFGRGWRVKADESGSLTDWKLIWLS